MLNPYFKYRCRLTPATVWAGFLNLGVQVFYCGQIVNEDLNILASDGAAVDAFGRSIVISNGTHNSGTEPRSVTTGDFNGDGVTDIATANYLSNSASVFLGWETGRLLPPKTLRREIAHFPSRHVTSTATA